MTAATVSFALPGVVTLRCAELALDERRSLEASPPFARWAHAHDTAVHKSLGEAALLAIGVEIGTWLEGPQQWLTRLLALATAPLMLELEVGTNEVGASVLAAPWELMAFEDRGHVRPLTVDPTVRLGAVRRLGIVGQPRPPQPHRLSVLCMAALPEGRPGLDVAARDCEFLDDVEAVATATRAIGVELAVEESGAANGLAAGALTRQVDVIQLAGDLQVEPPGLVLERERSGEQRVLSIGVGAADVEGGASVAVTATELQLALAGQVPGLVILPAPTSIAAARASQAIAATLCRQGWPAVLAWAAPVEGVEVRGFLASVYRHLAARARLDHAVAEARASSRAWPAPVLLLGPAGGDRLVSNSTPREIRVVYSPTYLDAAQRVAVWKPSDLFGYRGAVQVTVAALMGSDATAVAIHGAGARLRASLAARAAAAIDDRRRVVVQRRRQDRAEDLLDVLARTAASADLDRRIRAYLAEPPSTRARLAVFLRELLEGPCQRSKQGAVLLVLHDLRLRKPRTRGAEVVLPGASAVVTEVIEAFHGAATESRLLVTSASRFAVYTFGGVAVAGAVRFAPEAPIAPAPLSPARVRARRVTAATAGVSALAAVVVAAFAAAGALGGAEGGYRIGRWPYPALVGFSAVTTALFAWLARRPVSPRAARSAGASGWLLLAALIVCVPGATTLATMLPTASGNKAGVAPALPSIVDSGTVVILDAAAVDANPVDAMVVDATAVDAHAVLSAHGTPAVDAEPTVSSDARAVVTVDAAVDAGADAAVDARTDALVDATVHPVIDAPTRVEESGSVGDAGEPRVSSDRLDAGVDAPARQPRTRTNLVPAVETPVLAP